MGLSDVRTVAARRERPMGAPAVGLAEAKSVDRMKASAEDARAAHALQHQVDISEQEVAMLENERERLFREKDALATAVTKLDRVV